MLRTDILDALQAGAAVMARLEAGFFINYRLRLRNPVGCSKNSSSCAW
jgi:hypothetical protein